MKALDIVGEELKKAGVELAEEGIVKLFEAIQAAAPRLAAEADESWAKALGGIAVPVLAALKPGVDAAADLNKDGKIG